MSSMCCARTLPTCDHHHESYDLRQLFETGNGGALGTFTSFKRRRPTTPKWNEDLEDMELKVAFVMEVTVESAVFVSTFLSPPSFSHPRPAEAMALYLTMVGYSAEC